MKTSQNFTGAYDPMAGTLTMAAMQSQALGPRLPCLRPGQLCASCVAVSAGRGILALDPDSDKAGSRSDVQHD